MNKNYFQYNDGIGILPDTCKYRISPSQFSKFFDNSAQWWAEQIYKEAPEFQGSTASELGNCVHAGAEMYFDSKNIDHQSIISYVDSLTTPDIDKSEILAQYPIMLANLTTWLEANKGTNAEDFVHTEVLPGIHAAGSIDMYDTKKGIIYDYKTTGSLDKARIPTSFPRAYYFQQMLYAYILREQGHTINRLCLVYVTRDNTGRISEKTGKPLRDYPSTVEPLYHAITPDDWSLIESCVKLVAESIQTWQDNPELRHIICKDMRRKEKPKQPLFKD